MASSLKIFRKNQRVLMVITTGLAMISFVLLGAVQTRPSEMPTLLVVLALAAMVGGAAWVIGLVNQKSGEYGMAGAAIGAILGIALSWGNREPTAVYADSGNISLRELQTLHNDRQIANSFVRMAFQQMIGRDPGAINYFGGDSEREIITAELLRREGKRLGLAVTNEGAFDFIRGLGQGFLGDSGLTQQQFSEIRTRLKLSEQQLVDVLKSELLAQQTAVSLYQELSVPPESLWEYYKKLNVSEDCEVAVLPVSEFVDSSAEPPAAELEELFKKYATNRPGYTPEGRVEEGRPGFIQPARAKLAYLEAVFDDFEKQAGEVTDAEIEKRYEEVYKKPLTTPALPKGLESLLGPDGTIPEVTAPGTATPETPATGSTPPATETPAAPATETPAEPAKEPGAEAPVESPATEPSTEAPPATPPATEQPPETPAEPANEEPAKSSSQLTPRSTLSFVALQDEPKPETPPATDPASTETPAPATETPATPAVEAPPAETPAAPNTTETPAAETPAAPEAKADDSAPAPPVAEPASGGELAAPATGEAGQEAADPPLPTIRPLDDALRGEIRDEILRERAAALMDAKILEAVNFMSGEVGINVNLPSEDPAHLSSEDAAAKLKEFATKNGLVYVETPWQSYDELMQSEDFPIGKARIEIGMNNVPVVDDVMRNFGRSMKYQPRNARNPFTDSRFAYWVIDERPDFDPKDMSDELVRAAVVKAWREQKALAVARERADQIAKMLRESGDKPATEVLAEQTITGKPGTGFLTVRETGKFTWYRMPFVPPTAMRTAPPTLSQITGLETIGEEFMKKVFDGLKPGEIGTAENALKSEVYVVKVVSRTPADPEKDESFKSIFLARGVLPAYQALAQRDYLYYGKDAVEDLWKRENVRVVENDRKVASN